MNFRAELLIPILGVSLPFMVAIVAMLTSHQQKMAALVRQNGDLRDPRVDGLSEEVRQLRELVQQQAILVDNLAHRTEVRHL